MISLIVPAVLLLLGSAAGGAPDMPSISDLMEAQENRELRSIGDLNKYMDSLMDLSDLHMAKSFARETRRYRRGLNQKSVVINETRTVSLSFDDPSRTTAETFDNVQRMTVITTDDGDFVLLSYGAEHVLFKASQSGLLLEEIAEFTTAKETQGLSHVKGIKSGGKLWFAFGCDANNLVAVVSVDLVTKNVATQVLLRKGPIGGLHLFESHANVFLVVGMRFERSTSGEPLFASTYKLVNNFFDLQDELTFMAQNVTSVQGFFFRGECFILFGMNHKDGSQLYKFDTLLESMTLVQQLPVTNVERLVHFIEAQENKQYVLVNDGGELEIYRLAGERLLLWQDLDLSSLTTPLGGMSAFPISTMETVLMVGSGGKVTFFADDWSAAFHPNHQMLTNCNTIGDVSIVRMGGLHVLFYLCLEVLGDRTVDYKEVIMTEIELEAPTPTPEVLFECLSNVHDDLNDRKDNIDFLESAITNDIIMTTDKSQDWFDEVTFLNGLTVVGTTTINDVNITDESVSPNTMTFPTLKDLTTVLEENTMNLYDALDTLLYQNGDQTITSPQAAVFVKADTFQANTAKIEKLNEMPLLEMDTTFLLHGFDQNITSSMTFHSLTTDNFSTRGASVGTINGVQTDQYMRKGQAMQTVTGNHKYASITAGSITGETSCLALNTLDTCSIVTTGSSVTLTGEKTFSSLNVLKGVDISLLNEVDLSVLKEDLVFKNDFSTQILDGTYSFDSITVVGNADVGLINGVDMALLDSRAVKKNQNYELPSNVHYGNLTVTTLNSPTLNEVPWSSIVSDETSAIDGNYHFSTAVVSTAVISNDVNGLDISEEVVTTNTNQELNGKLTFSTLEVTGPQGLQMTELSKINEIDPNELVRVDVDGNLRVDDSVVFSNPIEVTGDVKASSINQLDLNNIESRYWRKALDQEVEVSPSLQMAAFSGNVTATSVNSHEVTDFLSTKGFQTIMGHYTFEDTVNVGGNLNVQDGMQINGIDLSALSSNAVLVNEVQEISTDMTFAGHLTITGDVMMTGRLNGWDVANDFIRLDQPSVTLGNLSFTSKTTANSVDQYMSNLFVGSLNGLDVKATVDDLVLLTEDATISGNLQVTGIANVETLTVSGTVDGVDVGDLAERSLKKVSSTPQLMSGKLTADNVVFNQSPSLGTVNAKDWATHLGSVVPLDHNGLIEGTKTFTQALNVAGDFDPKMINAAINISALVPRILTKTTDQVLTEKYTFSNDLTAGNVNVSVIDTVNTANLLLIDETNSISGTVAFDDDVIMTRLSSNSGILDSCNLVQVNETAIWKEANGDLVITFPFAVDTLTVSQDATFTEMKAGTAEVDIEHFLDNIVTLSQPQDISGKVEFTNDVSVSNLTAKSVDGVDIDTFYSVAVQDDEDIVINCNVEFAKPLTCGTLAVTSTVTGIAGGKVVINGLNVSSIHENAVLATGGTYTITGVKTFSNGLTAASLNVDGNLGTVPVSDLAILSNHDTIASNLVFQGQITVNGNVQVGGLLDGVDLPQLLLDRIKLDEAETLTSSTTFDDLKVQGNLVVESINDIPFSNIVVKSGRAQQTITGNKTFGGGLTVNGLIDASVINGIILSDLEATVVRKDTPATITKEIVFDNTVSATADIAVIGEVNGFDLSELAYDDSTLKSNIEEQSERLHSLNLTLSGVYINNNELACSMYATLDYGIELDEKTATFAGKMSLGNNGSLNLLTVSDCTPSCVCPSQSDLYEVGDDGTLTLLSTMDFGVLLLEPEGLHGLTLKHTCNGTGTTLIKMNDYSKSLHNARVNDAKTFTVTDDSGVNTTYLATIGSLESHEMTETSFINIYKLQSYAADLVVSMQTPISAVTIDTSYCHTEACYILVASNFASDDPIDPFTARSQLYVFTPEEELELSQEFTGQHVTSGLLLSSKADEDKKLVTIAQLKGSRPNYADNMKYDKGVMVYRHDVGYEPFQTLNSYGVVAQTSFYVAHDLFLVLLSKNSGTLDVYTHRPNEGFQLLQKIAVCKKPVDLVKTQDGRYVYVSCLDPARIVTVSFNEKGYYYEI